MKKVTKCNRGGGLENKAFTLIELLAVIIVIGVIALIVSPIVINTIRRSDKASFERSIDGLINAVRIDYSDDSFIVPRRYFYEKRNLTLIMKEGESKDEKVGTHGEINGNGFIYVDGEGIIHIENICNKDYCANGEEDDIIITPNPEGKVPDVNKDMPIITLNGESTIYVELGGEYQELGATAKTSTGEALEYSTEIKLNDTVIDTIDTNVERTYTIIYKATSNGQEASVTRKVIVLEMTPEITMTEPNSNYIKEQEVLITVSGIRPNVVERFSYQINDGESINVEGTNTKITLKETGETTITVTVEDNNGHRNTMSKLYRIDKIGPVITVEPKTVEIESKEVGSYDVLTGITVIDNIDGTIDNSKIVISGDKLKEVPGEYEIIYTASDRLGNSSSETRTIIVKDLTAPTIVFEPNGTEGYVKEQKVKIEVTDSNGVESISYVLIKEEERGESNTINSGESITINETGNYKIEVTARDTLGNEGTNRSETYYIDHTAPEITFEETEIKLDEVTGYELMTGVTVRDNVSSEEKIKVTYRGNLSATIGEQTITYEAEDEAGNKTEKIRTIKVTEANKPIVSFAPIETNGWVKEVNVIISATVKIGEEIKEFKYSVNEGTEQDGTINGNEGEANITLNETGTYRIKARATGGYENTKEEISGEYKIDKVSPTVGSISGNNSSWTSSKTLSATLTDSDSGIAYYLWTTSSSKPTETASGWTSVGTPTTTYSFSATVYSTGTYYLWAKDAAGNVSETSSSVSISYIDGTTPSLTVYNYSGKVGDSVSISSRYSASYGNAGGYTTCTYNGTTISNINYFTSAGTYTVSCRAYGNNGRNSGSKSMTVTLATPDTTTPTLTVNNYSGKVGDNVALSTKYTATFGSSGGYTTCTYNGTTITNVNYFKSSGTYTVSCTAYGNNGKNSGSKSMTITVTIPPTITASSYCSESDTRAGFAPKSLSPGQTYSGRCINASCPAGGGTCYITCAIVDQDLESPYVDSDDMWVGRCCTPGGGCRYSSDLKCYIYNDVQYTDYVNVSNGCKYYVKD